MKEKEKKVLAVLLAAATMICSIPMGPLYAYGETAAVESLAGAQKTASPSEAEKEKTASPSEAEKENYLIALPSQAAVFSGTYVLEAEDTGSGLANWENVNLNQDGKRVELQKGGSVTFNLDKVDDFAAGTYLLYANVNGNTHKLAVSVDGEKTGEIWKAEAGWEFGDLSEHECRGLLTLNGTEKIKVTEDGENYGHIDYVRLEQVEEPVYWLEAENGSLKASGGSASVHSDGDRVELNAQEGGAAVTFSMPSGFKAGNYKLFASINGARSKLNVSVDGLNRGSVSVPSGAHGQYEYGTCRESSLDEEIALAEESKITLSNDGTGSDHWGHVDYVRLQRTGNYKPKFIAEDEKTGIRIEAEEGVLADGTQLKVRKISGADKKAIRGSWEELGKKAALYGFYLADKNGTPLDFSEAKGSISASIRLPDGYQEAGAELYWLEGTDAGEAQSMIGWSVQNERICFQLDGGGEDGVYAIVSENSWTLEGEKYYQNTADGGKAANLQPGEVINFKIPEEESFEKGKYNLFVRACGYQNYTFLVNGGEAGTLEKAGTDWEDYQVYTAAVVLDLKQGDTLSIRADETYGWVDYIRLVPCKPFEQEVEGISVVAGAGVVPVDAELSVTPAEEQEQEQIAKLFGFTERETPKMVFYDISLLLAGEKIQPAGELTIRISIPGDFTKDKLSLYHISDEGKKYKLEFKLEDGMVEFQVSHLSRYGLIDGAVGSELYYEAENYYSVQLAGEGNSSADLQPGDSFTFTVSDEKQFAAGNYGLFVSANGNRTKLLVLINGQAAGVISLEAGEFDTASLKETAMTEVLSLTDGDEVTIYAPGAPGAGPYGWIDYVKLTESEAKPAEAKAKKKITLEAEDYYPDVLEEDGKAANLNNPAKSLEIPILASCGFEDKDYRLALYTTGTMHSFTVMVSGEEVLHQERSGSGYGMEYMTKEIGKQLIRLKPGDLLTICFPVQDTDNYGNWVDKVVLNSNRKAPDGRINTRFGGRIAENLAAVLLNSREPKTLTEGRKLIYEGEAYYTKQNDNPAADFQPGEQIIIPVSDNSAFADGTYYLSVRSCGLREAFTIKVNGMEMGSISRRSNDYGMDMITEDKMGTELTLCAGDLLCVESAKGASWGWVDSVCLEPVAKKAASQAQSSYTWEAEDFYPEQKENPAADLQPGEQIDIPLGSNSQFAEGSYYLLVKNCGSRTVLNVQKNGEQTGSICRSETGFSMGGMTLDVLMRPLHLTKDDTISLCAPGERGSPDGLFGWVDQVILKQAPAASPKALDEYLYPGQAYGTGSLFLAAADLQPGGSMEIPLSDNLDFMEGLYRIQIQSCGTREQFAVQLNHQTVGTVRRRGSGYGEGELSLDTLEQAVYLKPSDVLTITGQEGDFYGWVSNVILEPAGGPEPVTARAAQNSLTQEQQGSYFRSLTTDKSMYDPGTDIQATATFTGVGTAEAVMRLCHLGKTVWEDSGQVSLTAGSFSFTVPAPAADFKGYSLEIYLSIGGQLSDYAVTGVDVSSDWSMFPRYGYVTKMDRSAQEVRQALERLKDHHINGLFYYDVFDTQEKPLAGTPEEPAESWQTLNRSTAKKQTLLDTVNTGHELNMKSFFYNLIFGAYDNYEQAGISPEWGLYCDQRHMQQDVHDISGIGWETEKFWLMNPANTQWQDHYIKAHQELFAVYPYDGIQVDSLGPRGDRYDYFGNPVQLDNTYVPMLNRLAKELGKKVIFNPVSGYGLNPQLKAADYDIVYMEVWPADVPDFSTMKCKLDEICRSTQGKKGTVIAAYMNYGAPKTKKFNTPSINYVNAVLMAGGASHLELGDTGMLSSEYYPGNSMRISKKLEGDLRDGYSFLVAYENLLRGMGLVETKDETWLDGVRTGSDFKPGNVTSFTKIKTEEGEPEREVLHLINFDGASHDSWVDKGLAQTAPKIKTEITVRHRCSVAPAKIWAASPDCCGGIAQELEFSYEDGYVTFTLPSLEYYDMVVIE